MESVDAAAAAAAAGSGSGVGFFLSAFFFPMIPRPFFGAFAGGFGAGGNGWDGDFCLALFWIVSDSSCVCFNPGGVS